MKKLIVLIVPVLVIVLASGGYFLYKNGTSISSGSSQQISGSTEKANDSSKAVEKKVNGTFKELLSLGKNYSCTFETKDDVGNITKGTVFIAGAGDKLSGDFTLIQAGGEKMTSKVIRDGEYNYIWGSSFEQGIKTKIDRENDSVFGDTDDDSENSVGLNDDDNVDFDCTSWRVDDSKFVPPSDVEFMDFSVQIQKIQEAENQIPTVDCSTCDLVPAGESREQCLSALGCN